MRSGRLRRIVTAISMAAVSAAACLATVAAPAASAYPGPTTPVFDPNEADTRFVSLRTASAWATEFDRLTSQGYMVLDLEVVSMNVVLYGAVFQKKPAGLNWASRRDLSLSQFNNAHATYIAQGKRIADFETYQTSGGQRYAGVWVDGVGTKDAVLVKNTPSSQMQAVISTQRNAGRMPVDVEEYSVSGCTHCYATIWVKNIDQLGWQIWYGLRTDTFNDKFNELKNSHRIVAVNGALYKVDNTWPLPDDAYNKYSGVWLSDTRGRATTERRDMDDEELLWWRAQYDDQAGYRPLAFEAYPVKDTCTVGGGCIFTTNYAMVWREDD
jgi:Bacterial tandem repeat domain 1